MSAAPKMEGNPLFDKRLIAAFVEHVNKTMSNMAQTTVKPLKPFIEQDFTQRGDIAGMVGMVAPPLKGTLLITYPKTAIFKIVENMIGEKHTEIGTDVKDAVGELTNMIYGSTKTTLNQLGYNFEMAIPSVITGEFIISKGSNSSGATLVIPFELDNQSVFYVEITVQD